MRAPAVLNAPAVKAIPATRNADGPVKTMRYTAYAFVWAVLIVYVFILWRRIARVERELGEVNRKLAKR